MNIHEDISKAEAKLRDLNAKIKNAENTLRQVCDATQAMKARLEKYDSDLRKAMRG